MLEPDAGESLGYRVTVLPAPVVEGFKFNDLWADDIGARDVFAGSGCDGGGSLAIVWTRDALGTWSAQYLPGTRKGLTVARVPAANGWPLILADVGEEVNVFEADAFGHYTVVDFPLPAGYDLFRPFTDLWPDTWDVFDAPAYWDATATKVPSPASSSASSAAPPTTRTTTASRSCRRRARTAGRPCQTRRRRSKASRSPAA